MNSRKIYIATAYANLELAQDYARALCGFDIVSSWHTLPVADERELSEEEIRRLAARNFMDLATADAVLALMHVGEPRVTYAEVGYALARGRHVVWTHAGPRGRRPFLDCFAARVDLNTCVDPIRAVTQALLYRALRCELLLYP